MAYTQKTSQTNGVFGENEDMVCYINTFGLLVMYFIMYTVKRYSHVKIAIFHTPIE